MATELSSEVLDGLKVLGEHFDASATRALVQAAFVAAESAQDTSHEASLLDKVGDVDPALVKQAFASLLTFVVEASKLDYPREEVVSVIEDCELSPDQIQLIGEGYAKLHRAVRQRLAQTSTELSKVIGVDWRLDYYVKSDMVESVKVPVYFVSLTTQEPDGSISSVELTCNYQELQDLVAKLKDAVKSVERVLDNY